MRSECFRCVNVKSFKLRGVIISLITSNYRVKPIWGKLLDLQSSLVLNAMVRYSSYLIAYLFDTWGMQTLSSIYTCVVVFDLFAYLKHLFFYSFF